MRNQFLILFVVLCLVAGVVKSETSIEVDENGNEYEVKRFNIAGRKLSGGRPHCVITRRKRSPGFGRSGYGSGNDNDNDEAENSYIEDQYMSKLPPSPTSTFADDNSTDEDDNEEQEDENNTDQQEIDTQYIDAQPVDSHPVVNASKVIHSNDIVLIQYDTPPKVDPLTHAVFELHPVIPDGNDSEDENVMGHPFREGDDQPNKENNKKPLINVVSIRRRPRPKPNTLNTNRKPGQLGNNDTKLKKKSNKKQTNTTLQDQSNALPNRRHPGNTSMNRLPAKAQTGNNNTRRRRPTNVPNANNTRRKNQNSNNKNRILGVNASQTNKKQNESGNKKWGNIIKDIVTITTTGSSDNNRDVNCIFIEKAPTQRRRRIKVTKTTTTTTTTTRRPFWRILGRNVVESPHNGYGRRKNVNLRFLV